MFLKNFNRRQQLTVIVFAVANFCSAICVSLQAPFYPGEAEKKGATPSEYGFVFGIFELTVFIISPIVGKNLSRLGAKRVFNAGIFLTGTCSILFGLLDHIENGTTFIVLSFVIRSIEAIGNSGFLTASFSIIAQEFPDKVATMFASMETCFGLGLIVGPSVGGALYQVGGYMVPFVTMGSMLIAASCFTFFVLPSHYNERATNERADKGLIAVLKISTIVLASYSVFCASVSLGFLQATLEPHLRQFQLSPLTMGAMFVVNGGTYAVTAPIWGWLCDKKLDPKLVTSVGAGLVAISFAFLGPLPFLHFETIFEVCIISLVIHGVGFAAILVSGFALAHREAVAFGFPDNLNTYALISSLWTSTFALGAFVGPSIAGVLVDHFSFGWSSLFVVITELSVFLVAFIFMCIIPTKRPVKIVKEPLEEDSEVSPLISDRDRDDDFESRRSPSIGYDSLESTPVPGTSPTDEHRRAKASSVPRSRVVFSPFVSPLEGVSMMSMMGCSMSAASHATSLIPSEHLETIYERPVTRGETAQRKSRRHRGGAENSRKSRRKSQDKAAADQSQRGGQANPEAGDKSGNSSSRIQVTALVEDHRTMSDESSIG